MALTIPTFGSFSYKAGQQRPSPFIMRTLKSMPPFQTNDVILEGGVHTGVNTKAIAKQYPHIPLQCFDLLAKYPKNLRQWAKYHGLPNVNAFTASLLDPNKIIKSLKGRIKLGVLGEGVAGHLSGKELADYLIALKPHTSKDGLHLVSVAPSNELGDANIWELPFASHALAIHFREQLAKLGLKTDAATDMATGIVTLIRDANREAKQRGTRATHIGELKDTLQAAGYVIEVLPYQKINEPIRVDLKEPQLISTHKGPDLRLTGAEVIDEKPIKQKDLAFLKITNAKKETLKKAKKRNAK